MNNIEEIKLEIRKTKLQQENIEYRLKLLQIQLEDETTKAHTTEDCGVTSEGQRCERPKGHSTEGPYGYHESYGWHGRSQKRW